MPLISKKSIDYEHFNINKCQLKNSLSFEVLCKQDDPNSRLKFIQSALYWFEHWQDWQQRYLITKIVESLPYNKLIFLKSGFQWVSNKNLGNNKNTVPNNKNYLDKKETKLKELSMKYILSEPCKEGIVKKTKFTNYERARWLLSHYIALLQKEYISENVDSNEVSEVENELKIPLDSEYIPSFSFPLLGEPEKEVKLSINDFVKKLSECKAKKKQLV